MEIEALLKRAGYDGPRDVSLETLAALQRTFIETVPFENLDIHTGREIVLDVDRFYRKVVGRRRGGFCYELNALFAWLLAALGFDVAMISARMATPAGFAPEFGHMALVVSLDSERYLVDVGNGQSVRTPLSLTRREIAETPEGIRYRVDTIETRYALFMTDDDGQWLPRFSFETTPRALLDYSQMCRFHQTSPQSPFTQNRLVTLAKPDGRITLLNDLLTIVSVDGTKTVEVEGEGEFDRTLKSVFGINLDG